MASCICVEYSKKLVDVSMVDLVQKEEMTSIKYEVLGIV